MSIRQVLVAGVAFLTAVAGAEVTTKTIEYRDGDTVLEGMVAWDPAQVEPGKKAPAVIIVHQYMGLGDYEKKRAAMLAEMGYVAFAADIYGKGVRAKSASEAGGLAGRFKGDLPLYRSRLLAALAATKAQPGVDPERIAAIGYCFGGTGALELARTGADVVGVVSFHGGLATDDPANASKIVGRVLVCHGAADPLVPPAEVDAFVKSMEAAKVDYTFIGYGGAKHAFTDSNVPDGPAVGYQAKADVRSWRDMTEFLREVFAR